ACVLFAQQGFKFAGKSPRRLEASVPIEIVRKMTMNRARDMPGDSLAIAGVAARAGAASSVENDAAACEHQLSYALMIDYLAQGRAQMRVAARTEHWRRLRKREPGFVPALDSSVEHGRGAM